LPEKTQLPFVFFVLALEKKKKRNKEGRKKESKG